MFLDFAGGTLLVAAIVFNAVAFLGALDIGRMARLGLAAAAGLWVGLQISLALAGAFTSAFATTSPLVGVMVAAPVIAAAVAALLSSTAREAMLGVPTPLLVGLNAARIFGAFFLLLAADGRLGGPFPQSAGWGDVITGALAVPLAFYATRQSARPAVFWWNVFGATDLIVAIVLGTLSFNGSFAQVIHAGAGSDAVAGMPWSLIPTVLVPFYLVTHGIVFAQLRHASRIAAATKADA